MPAARFVAPATPEVVAPLRRQTLAQIRAWGVQLDESTVGNLALLVSELVTNAVLHAGGALVILTLRLEAGRVLVEVHDLSRSLPAPREAFEDDESGRGLALVEALADRYGVEPTAIGKKCWAEFALPRKGRPVDLVCRRHLVALGPCQVGEYAHDHR